MKIDSPAELEFTITRSFDAPRDLVWKAFTEPERLMHWWGPKGFTMVEAKVDLRPGGVYHYGMKAPDGAEMWGLWTYKEIVAPERLVVLVSFSDADGGITTHPMNPDWPREMISVMTLVDEGSKTSVTITAAPYNATETEITTFEAGKSSMDQGFSGTFEQLDAYLADALKGGF